VKPPFIDENHVSDYPYLEFVVNRAMSSYHNEFTRVITPIMPVAFS
jgi:hypothetical protein